MEALGRSFHGSEALNLLRSRLAIACLCLATLTISMSTQARVLSDLEFMYAESFASSTSHDVDLECRIASAVIKADNDETPCSPTELSYGARVLVSYRAAVRAANDADFIANDYAAASASQATADEKDPMADQSACAVAISDGHWGSINNPRVPTHPPSCSDEMVSYGRRMISDYKRAIAAMDKLP